MLKREVLILVTPKSSTLYLIFNQHYPLPPLNSLFPVLLELSLTLLSPNPQLGLYTFFLPILFPFHLL